MYEVKGPRSGVVWDPEHNRPLAVFRDGRYQTGDNAAAEKLKALGYIVEGGPKAGKKSAGGG